MSETSNSNDFILPRHVAVVMDGNGRWANKRHLPRAAGHKAGVSSTREIVENCAKKGIEALTIFAFSSENWNRPESEVSSLMLLFVSTITAEVKKLHKKNVRVQFIGDRTRFSEKLQSSINDSEVLTRDNTGLHLNIAANYGGRWDIVNANATLFIGGGDPYILSKLTDDSLVYGFRDTLVAPIADQTFWEFSLHPGVYRGTGKKLYLPELGTDNCFKR